MSECASRRVECDCQMGGFFLLDEFEDIFCESEEDGHVCTLGVEYRMTQECVVHLEYQGVSVYQEKSFIHCLWYLFGSMAK